MTTIDWSEFSNSVQSKLTKNSAISPITKRTQQAKISCMEIPELESNRSTCLMACFGVRRSASARPAPMARIPRLAAWSTPSTPFVRDSTRLAWKSCSKTLLTNCTTCLRATFRRNRRPALLRTATTTTLQNCQNYNTCRELHLHRIKRARNEGTTQLNYRNFRTVHQQVHIPLSIHAHCRS